MRRGRKGLKRNPEKIRAWSDKHRGALQRSSREDGDAATEAGSTLSRGRSGKRKVRIPPGIRGYVRARSHGVCVVCLYRQGLAVDAVTAGALRMLVRRGVLGAIAQLHHVLPEAEYPKYALEEDNLVGVCVTCHGDHEHGTRRIPRGALPDVAVEFAAREGLSWYVDRYYSDELAA